MLMQGLSLPSPTQPLPPARQRPSSPPSTPTDPHPFHEPEDTTERACVRGSSRQSTPVPFPVQSIVPMPASQKLRNTPVLEQATLPTEVVQLAEVEVQSTHVEFVGSQWHQQGIASSMANGTVQILWNRYQKKSGWLKEGLRKVGGATNILYTGTKASLLSSFLVPIHLYICEI